ncbi:MAG: tetratricopeptide repeat protein [Lewinellaceae bacterium]|nr:tetratricopeptide repeat protein [Lewinellaceae bacterium]
MSMTISRTMPGRSNIIKKAALQVVLNDELGIATSHNNIGNVYLSQGAHDKALEFYNKSLDLRQKLQDQRGIAIALANIGLALPGAGPTPTIGRVCLEKHRHPERIGQKS